MVHGIGGRGGSGDEALGPQPKLASPKKAPWLATLLLPSVANQTKTDVGWLADFEQCLALAILREEGGG